MAGEQSAGAGHMDMAAVAQALGLGIAGVVGKNTAAELVAEGAQNHNFGAVAVVVQPEPGCCMSLVAVVGLGSGRAPGRAPGRADMWCCLPGLPSAQVHNDIVVLRRMDYKLRWRLLLRQGPRAVGVCHYWASRHNPGDGKFGMAGTESSRQKPWARLE